MFLKKSKNKKREGVAKRVYDNTQKKKKNKGQKQIHYEPKLNSNSDLTIRMKIIPGILHQVAYILMCKLQLDVKGKSKKGEKRKKKKVKGLVSISFRRHRYEKDVKNKGIPTQEKKIIVTTALLTVKTLYD